MNARADNRVRFCGYVIPLLGVFVLVLASSRATRAEELIFPLEEISVFDLPEETGREFLVGQRIVCGDRADPNVRVYPKFASDQPIYGAASFTDQPGQDDPYKAFHFALDESAGTGTGYDRLYFDVNRDRDLTNDTVLTVQKDPPAKAMLGYSGLKQQVCFENLAPPLPCGREGEKPLEMMPRLLVSEKGYKALCLVTTKARKGRIELGRQKCDVILGHCYVVSGWFDRPYTALHVVREGNSRKWDWWGGDRLDAMHRVNETLYTFSATPLGDKLIVRPYDGPWGTFEVGAGGRKIDRFEITGSLRSENAAVAVGEVGDSSRPEYTRSCRLPVGDYLPEYVSLQYGTLRINISNNYHSDGKPRDMKSDRWVYGIAIREDKPFVFDFSNKPAVMFASPARDSRVKAGEELSVKAVLIDPVLDFMIRDLSVDKSRSESLDPKVTIARANGEIVAEGVMPFG